MYLQHCLLPRLDLLTIFLHASESTITICPLCAFNLYWLPIYFTWRYSEEEYSIQVFRGFLIPIINTTFIELYTTAYLRNSFFPRLILRLNLLHLCCKRDQSITLPKTVSSIDVYYTSPSNNQSSENSSNGKAPVFRYLSTRQSTPSSSRKWNTPRQVWVKC